MGYFVRINKKYTLELHAKSDVLLCEICNKDEKVNAILRYKTRIIIKTNRGDIFTPIISHSTYFCKKCLKKYKLDINDIPRIKKGLALMKMKEIIG